MLKSPCVITIYSLTLIITYMYVYYPFEATIFDVLFTCE